MDQPEQEIIVRITPSWARRVFAAGVLGALGTLLVLVAVLRPPATLPTQLFLIAFGCVGLFACGRLWQATGRSLTLTKEGLFDDDGEAVAPIDAILRAERGVFAFKPSNGFVLTLSRPLPRAWAPGLWWRLGRRVGVGGTISGAEGRAMADAISAMIALRAAPARTD